MRFEGRRALRRAPGLTPLIDVVFLLLIFFMLATRFGNESQLPLQLVVETLPAPVDDASGRSTTDAKRDAVVIRLAADGSTWLEGARLDADSLTDHLSESLRVEPARHVVVTPEGSVSVQRIVDALQGASHAGARAVSLAEAH